MITLKTVVRALFAGITMGTMIPEMLEMPQMPQITNLAEQSGLKADTCRPWGKAEGDVPEDWSIMTTEEVE